MLTQHPPFGSRIDRQTSVVVTLGTPQIPVGARVRSAVPPALSAEAQAEATSEARPQSEGP